MYGRPGSPIQFGTKPAAKKRGRPSALAKFLEKQRDLFPVDLYTSKLSQAARLDGAGQAAARSAARTAARSAASPPATKRGGKVNAENRGESINQLKTIKKVSE